MASAGSEIIRRDARPPIKTDAAPSSDPAGATRTTARTRPMVSPTLLPSAEEGMDPTDPAARTLWAHVIGRGAVADLMRLRRAAQRGVSIRQPLHLQTLLAEGLAHHSGHHIIVLDAFPSLGPAHVRRLPPRLRKAVSTRDHG